MKVTPDVSLSVELRFYGWTTVTRYDARNSFLHHRLREKLVVKRPHAKQRRQERSLNHDSFIQDI